LSTKKQTKALKRQTKRFFMCSKPVYLDCNATTPIEPEVYDIICHYLQVEYGNSSSRTHAWGAVANKAVVKARETIAEVVNAKTEEVIFTSGATESNNIALLGLGDHGDITARKHIITTCIEHKVVLELLEVLVK